jgi:predicted porin
VNLQGLALAFVLVAAGAAAQEKPKTDEKPKADDKPRVEISGYAQFDYRRGDRADLASAPAHEFNGRRARLSFAAKVTDRLSLSTTVQGDGLNANSASLIDVALAVQLTPWLRTQAGQYKYDFDMSARDSASTLTLVDRTYATQAIAGGLNGASTPSSASGSSRDRGVSLVAERARGKLAFSLGGFQGTGRASDNNGSLSWVARVQGTPRAGLRLSAGYLHSETGDPGKPGPHHFRGWTAGAAYEWKRVFARAEYYGARRKRESIRQAPDGFYVETAVGLPRNFEALARYQRLDDPAVSVAGAVSSVDLGGRYWLARRGSRGGSSLVANVMLRDAPAGPLAGLTLLNDGRGTPLTSGHQVKPVFALRLQIQF